MQISMRTSKYGGSVVCHYFPCPTNSTAIFLLDELEFLSFHDSTIIIIFWRISFLMILIVFLAGVIFKCLHHKDNVEPCQLLMAVVKIDEKK